MKMNRVELSDYLADIDMEIMSQLLDCVWHGSSQQYIFPKVSIADRGHIPSFKKVLKAASKSSEPSCSENVISIRLLGSSPHNTLNQNQPFSSNSMMSFLDQRSVHLGSNKFDFIYLRQSEKSKSTGQRIKDN